MDISVIIPVYNEERYLSQCLDSIINQHFDGEYEVLVVDDASTDRTPDILHEFLTQYPNLFKVITRTENKGVSANYVELAQMAQGKYLAFCDSDDFWMDEDKLQKQFEYMQQNPQCGLYCSAANVINAVSGILVKRETAYAISLVDLLNNTDDIFCSTIICRKDLFLQMVKETVWYIDRNWFYDTIWSYWFAYHSKVEYSDEVFAGYRILADSDSHSSDYGRNLRLINRNFQIKLQFILTHKLDTQCGMEILNNEYNYMLKQALYIGEEKVRKSRRYKFGSQIKHLLKK